MGSLIDAGQTNQPSDGHVHAARQTKPNQTSSPPTKAGQTNQARKGHGHLLSCSSKHKSWKFESRPVKSSTFLGRLRPVQFNCLRRQLGKSCFYQLGFQLFNFSHIDGTGLVSSEYIKHHVVSHIFSHGPRVCQYHIGLLDSWLIFPVQVHQSMLMNFLN